MTVNIKKLEWDTDFFKIPCSRIEFLSDEINSDAFIDIKKNEVIRKSRFISIYNANNCIKNNTLISEFTNSFFIDFNIQLEKRRNKNSIKNDRIVCLNHENFSIEDLAFEPNFEKSRFSKDINIGEEKSIQLYKHWIFNALDDNHRLVLGHKSREDRAFNGLCVANLQGNKTIVELIIVSEMVRKAGIGKLLLETVESYSKSEHIVVGTQGDNHSAINFYHSFGFNQVNVASIFHWWKKD